MGHLRIAEDIDAIIHREFVPQRVDVNQRHHGQKQSDARGFLHCTSAHHRVLAPGMSLRPENKNTSKMRVERVGDAAPVPNLLIYGTTKFSRAQSLDGIGPSVQQTP